jgi:hypothetical protein
MPRVRQPSTFRNLICPEASSGQNNMAAVSSDGSTVCVLMRRFNSSCSRSIAFVVRALFRCDGTVCGLPQLQRVHWDMF